MRSRRPRTPQERRPLVNLSRLETLGDAIFAFSLTLLALDLRLPEMAPPNLVLGLLAMLPKLLVFVFAFLVIAQEWDVHQRTVMHIVRADGAFVWFYLLSLMFVVLMPASADILGRYPLQVPALVFFGANTALLCLASWAMWLYASHAGRLIGADTDPRMVRMIADLWLYPPLVIVLTMPLALINVYPVYAIWLLLPLVSYSYSHWSARQRQIQGGLRSSPRRPRTGP